MGNSQSFRTGSTALKDQWSKKGPADLKEKNEALASIVSGLDLDFVKERWAWCVSPSGVVSTLQGRNSEIFAASGN
jgi:hypothetical protein